MTLGIKFMTGLMIARARLFAVLLTGLFLAGCADATFIGGGDSSYDGVWRGRILFTLGERVCPRRGSLVADISSGRMIAEVRWSDGSQGRFVGTVQETKLVAAKIQREGKTFAEASGTFSERTAEGRFEGARCKGSWELQKVRNAG